MRPNLLERLFFMCDLYPVLRPLLFCFDAERAHHLAVLGLRYGPSLGGRRVVDPALQTTVAGLAFQNPIGMAAGFDKNAEVIGPVLKLGFGFTEVGTVTPKPQAGNPQPRMFRLVEQQAVINRMGFNNKGLEGYTARLKKRPRTLGIVGANIGKNKDTADAISDYEIGLRAVAEFADYVTINVSSPNTPGLRALQEKSDLSNLLTRLQAVRKDCAKQPPLFLKIAPDLDETMRQGIAEVALETGIDALIISNTTISRPLPESTPHGAETGGLSGRPVFALSTAVLADMYKRTHGKVPLIGVGGVFNGADAYAKIRAGASLVQVYSAMVYEGPCLANRINAELLTLLKQDGFTSVADAVGADHRI
jgi:dihydroorotate dehydrogenase